MVVLGGNEELCVHSNHEIIPKLGRKQKSDDWLGYNP